MALISRSVPFPGPPRHFFLSFLGFSIVTNYRTYTLYLLAMTKTTTTRVKRCEYVPQRFSFPPNAELAIPPSPPILMRWPWSDSFIAGLVSKCQVFPILADGDHVGLVANDPAKPPELRGDLFGQGQFDGSLGLQVLHNPDPVGFPFLGDFPGTTVCRARRPCPLNRAASIPPRSSGQLIAWRLGGSLRLVSRLSLIPSEPGDRSSFAVQAISFTARVWWTGKTYRSLPAQSARMQSSVTRRAGWDSRAEYRGRFTCFR